MQEKIFGSIRDVPKEQWNALVDGRSCAYSHEFWELIEQSRLNDFRYHYAMFYDANGRPSCLTAFYTITTDLAIFAPPALKYILSGIRRVFPNFMKVRMLECGTPITLNHPFVADGGDPDPETIRAINATLLGAAKRERAFLIVLRDFGVQDGALQSALDRLGYHFVDSLPNTYMEIRWSTPDQYLDAMKSYYRSKLLKHLRINQKQGVRHELREDFSALAEQLCRQWRMVHDHASEYQREVLTPEFYRGLSQKLGARSKVLLFYRQDELIGHALLLMDGEMLRWMYFGRNEARNDSLYIYVGHKIVETAILLGAKRLELGVTTYPVKKDLGAQMSPLQLALQSPSRLINPWIGIFYPLLNRTPRIENKNIFKTG